MNVLILYLLTIIVPVIDSEPEGLKVGDKAPNFIGTDQMGNEVVLTDVLKEGKVILTFYRGAWCRYCMKQMNDYQDSLAMIHEKGATLIAISPEHDKGIQLTVEKAGVQFSLIHDDNLDIMKDYDVISDEKLEEFRRLSKETEEDITRKYIPVPAIYIINETGIIEFVSFNANYKERVSVAELLANL